MNSNQDFLIRAAQNLREKGVQIDHPYEVVDLMPLVKMQPDLDDLRIGAYYRSQNGNVFCHLCGAKRHQLGITAKYRNQGTILFGSECAKKQFGQEIWSKIERKQKEKKERINQIFFGQWINTQIHNTENWFQRNEGLVEACLKVWRDLEVGHPNLCAQLLELITLNRGKLTRTETHQVNQDALEGGFKERFTQTTHIVASISDWDGVQKIENLSSNTMSVRLFVKNVQCLEKPSEQDFARWEEHFNSNIRHAAFDIDKVINFTCHIFQEKNLLPWTQELDRRRVIDLMDEGNENITPRNSAKTVLKEVGHGFEKPKVSLSNCIPNFSDERRNFALSQIRQ